MKEKEIHFEWEQWNVQKNEQKHGVSWLEAESVFFDGNLKIFEDLRHSSAKEKRWIGYGKSKNTRILMVAFTIKLEKIRIISTRTASRKERSIYDEK